MRLETTATLTTIAANGLQFVVAYADINRLSAPGRTVMVLSAAVVGVVGIFTWHRSTPDLRPDLRNMIAAVALLGVSCVTVTLVSHIAIQRNVVLDQRLQSTKGALHVRAARSPAKITLTLVPLDGDLAISKTFSNDDTAPRDSQVVQIGERTVSIKNFRYPQEVVLMFTTTSTAVRTRRYSDPIDVQFIWQDAAAKIWERNVLIGGGVCIALASLLFWLSSRARWMERHATAPSRTAALSEIS